MCELSAGERKRGTRRDVVSDNHCDACWNFIHRLVFRKYNFKTNSSRACLYIHWMNELVDELVDEPKITTT